MSRFQRAVVPFILTLVCVVAAAGGHTVAILGDSNTWIGGDRCDNPKGWNYWLAKSMPESRFLSFARSGATWSHTAATRLDTVENIGVLGPNNVIYNQIARLGNYVATHPGFRPDMVIVAAGTNDAWFRDHRPGMLTDTLSLASDELALLPPCEVRSLRDAVRMGCALIRRVAPQAEIVVMTPLQTTAASDSVQRLVSDIIEKAASGEGARTLRQDSVCPVRSAAERRRKTLTTDGTHTSPEGARRCAKALRPLLFP